jgi:hypothetical protein
MPRPFVSNLWYYGCPFDKSKSQKHKVTDAFWEFHTDMNDSYREVNDANASC